MSLYIVIVYVIVKVMSVFIISLPIKEKLLFVRTCVPSVYEVLLSRTGAGKYTPLVLLSVTLYWVLLREAHAILTFSYCAQPWRILWSWSERVLFFPCGVPFSQNFWSPIPLGLLLYAFFPFSIHSQALSFYFWLWLCSFKLTAFIWQALQG